MPTDVTRTGLVPTPRRSAVLRPPMTSPSSKTSKFQSDIKVGRPAPDFNSIHRRLVKKFDLLKVEDELNSPPVEEQYAYNYYGEKCLVETPKCLVQTPESATKHTNRSRRVREITSVTKRTPDKCSFGHEYLSLSTGKLIDRRKFPKLNLKPVRLIPLSNTKNKTSSDGPERVQSSEDTQPTWSEILSHPSDRSVTPGRQCELEREVDVVLTPNRPKVSRNLLAEIQKAEALLDDDEEGIQKDLGLLDDLQAILKENTSPERQRCSNDSVMKPSSPETLKPLLRPTIRPWRAPKPPKVVIKPVPVTPPGQKSTESTSPQLSPIMETAESSQAHTAKPPPIKYSPVFYIERKRLSTIYETSHETHGKSSLSSQDSPSILSELESTDPRSSPPLSVSSAEIQRSISTPLSASERRLREVTCRYHNLLLDEEVALYTCCKAMKFSPVSPARRPMENPIAELLTDGDEAHFAPIRLSAEFRVPCIGASAFQKGFLL